MRRQFLILFLSACASPPLLSQTAESVGLPRPPAPPSLEEFALRRAKLARANALRHPGERVVILVRGALQAADMGAFVQNQDSLYLTAVIEPGLALILVPDGDSNLGRRTCTRHGNHRRTGRLPAPAGHGLPARIEDTVLVTTDGHENLSGHLPSSPDDIEALMRQEGVIEVPVGLGSR